MRKILLISLATAVACQDTEEVQSTDAQPQAEGSVESGTQETMEESRDWTVQNDFAGGLDQGMDDLVFYEEIEPNEEVTEEPAEDWGAVPMAEGFYNGTIEMVFSNTCDELAVGDVFDTQFEINDNGSTLLGGGLLESNGDQLRLNRLKERPVEGTVDCVKVETIDAVGTMFNSEEMELEVRTEVSMMGSDCPMVDPCSDQYLSFLGLVQDNG
jgi:hypothetical protein